MSGQVHSLGAGDRGGEPFPWRLVAVGSILLLEVSLLVPWVRLLTAGSRPPSAWILLLWLFISAWLARSIARLADRRQLAPALTRLLSAAGLFGSILVTVNLYFSPTAPLAFGEASVRLLRALPRLLPPAPEVVLVVSLGLVWRWGTAAASPTVLEHGRTGFKFRAGVILSAGLVILRSRGGDPWIPELLPPFLFGSLLAMTLTKTHSLADQRGAGEPPFSLQWLLGLIALLALTLAVGLAISWGLNTPAALRVLAGLRTVLLLLMYLIMLPVLLLLGPFLNRFILRLRDSISAFAEEDLPFEISPPLPRGFGSAEPAPIVESLVHWLEQLAAIWPILRVGLGALIVGLILSFAIRRARRQGLGEWERGGGADEGARLQPRRDRPLGKRLAGVGGSLQSFGRALLAGELRTALVVRRIYARLLTLAAERGRARRPWETPLELETALVELFPSAGEAVGVITRAYIQVRYGEFPESADRVKEVRVAWRRVQEAAG